jgi:hypothetical protein
MAMLFKILLASLFLVTSYAFAQSIFDQPAATAPSKSGPMTADDFRNAAKQIHQDTMSQLKDESKALLPAPSTNNSANKGATAPSTQPTAPLPSNNDNSFSSVNTDSGQNPQPGSGGAPAASKPNDTYSGFGGGSSNSGSKKSNTPASSGSSGGWNINY